ncbi:hypothetical protein ACQP3D_29135, partial [Escherichia coli]
NHKSSPNSKFLLCFVHLDFLNNSIIVLDYTLLNPKITERAQMGDEMAQAFDPQMFTMYENDAFY